MGLEGVRVRIRVRVRVGVPEWRRLQRQQIAAKVRVRGLG